MSAIDVHVHAFPDDLGPRAIAKLEAQCPWRSVARGTIGELIESMDAADIDVSVVCTIATRPDQTKGIFNWCRKIRSDRIEPLPSVHPQTPKASRWIERIAKAGFAGIKLHPMYQDFAVDDPQMDEIYTAAADCGLLVTAHCGHDIAFPIDERAAPQRIRRVIDRFGKLKLICTHMGGWRHWDAAEKYVIGADVYLETSFSMRELGRERTVELIRRHGADRVMFGTDWPWDSQADEIQRIRSLHLSDTDTRAILYANAAKLLRY